MVTAVTHHYCENITYAPNFVCGRYNYEILTATDSIPALWFNQYLYIESWKCKTKFFHLIFRHNFLVICWIRQLIYICWASASCNSIKTSTYTNKKMIKSWETYLLCFDIFRKNIFLWKASVIKRMGRKFWSRQQYRSCAQQLFRKLVSRSWFFPNNTSLTAVLNSCKALKTVRTSLVSATKRYF